MNDDEQKLVFFLGGYDLEMLAIREILTQKQIAFFDNGLSWGAAASSYSSELKACLSRGELPILVELNDDLELGDSVLHVDHHGMLAGKDQPTSLEQVFRLLKLAASEWTRRLELIAANDRGYIEGMLALTLPATRDEIQQIRAEDRAAQGITAEEEQLGRSAIEARELYANSRLTVIDLPHARTATVTDALHQSLGGQGFENLLLFCPSSTLFFGVGRGIQFLNSQYPGGWYGGDLPDRGYWGISRKLAPTELISNLEKTLNTKPANEIEVKAFHHVLMWPMLMRGSDADERSIEPFIEAFKAAAWNEVTSNQDAVDNDYTYEEIVYFHPFVRDLLFCNVQDDNQKRVRRRMVRHDLKYLDVTIKPDPKKPEEDFSVQLCVERAELLLIRPRIVILLFELSNRKYSTTNASPKIMEYIEPRIGDDRVALRLDQVMQLQGRLRRIFPPYFMGELHGDSPAEIAWNGEPSVGRHSTTGSRDEFKDFTMVGAEPPAYRHWMQLFNSVDAPDRIQCLMKPPRRRPDGLFLQQLLDDRMPGMSYLAVDNPDAITEEDQDCLVDFNASGFVYQKEFRDRERKLFRYDRFRHWGTTYFCNGTSFTLLCNTYKDEKTGQRFSDLLLNHFRRHYTHLAVLAQYQHAGLLYFVDELAEIAESMEPLEESTGVQDYAKSSKQPWRSRMRRLQHGFLKFRTRSFFTEVSNQIQGKDLFRLWYDLLGTGELFDRVAANFSEIYEAAETEEIHDLTEAQHKLAAEQRRLSNLATTGLAATIALAATAVFLTWVSLYPEEVKSKPFVLGTPVWGPWIWFIFAVGVFFLGFLAFRTYADRVITRNGKSEP